MRFKVTFFFIIVLSILAVWIVLPTSKFPFKLGLDLQGGIQLVLLADASDLSLESSELAVESARRVIEKRVNLYGVQESQVVSSKLGTKSRIIVELPGVQDASAAAELVGKTAQLDFREQVGAPPEATASANEYLKTFKSTGLTGADLKKAGVSFGTSRDAKAGPNVSIEFTGEGAKKFAEVTKRNIGKPLGIFLDDQIITFPAPIVQQEIIGGQAVISGDFTTKEAKDLSIQLNAGALPIPIKILEMRSIGASLGVQSLKKSLLVGVVGISLLIAYIISYYGLNGFIASISLCIYAALTLAIFKTGLFILPPVTLGLAGIAGFILSVGMAVDANILIFERMKEELRDGKDRPRALDLGFKRAWASIRDSNISSLITSGILIFMGTGFVKGFALTLGIGVLVSMFTSMVVTKTLLKLTLKN